MVKHPLLISLLLSTSILSACGGGSGQSAEQYDDSELLGKKTPHHQNKKPNNSSPSDPTTSPDTTSPDTTSPDTTSPQPSPTPVPAGALSAQQLLDDMTKRHESFAHGVNPYWGWGTNPRVHVGVNFPSDFDNPHFTPWGIVASSTDGSPARNVRVQIRKMILDVKRNGSWSRIVYNTNDSQLMGSLYTNYETNAHAPANLRKHGADGISVRLPDSGGSFHFYSSERFPVARGAQEIVSRVEARLIVDDANRSDDRASARLLVNSGGDIWRNRTATWDPSTVSNVDFAIGRFKYVTNEWKSFTSHTLTTQSEIDDYLAREGVLSPR